VAAADAARSGASPGRDGAGRAHSLVATGETVGAAVSASVRRKIMAEATEDNKATETTSGKKTRPAIPKAIKDAVLNEFNHRCAICGEARPQVHHIDENPANNDPTNLIPLCPNCHLIDQHNPTEPMDPVKLALFRKHKDPLILSPQFHPIFKRVLSIEIEARKKDISNIGLRVGLLYAVYDLTDFLLQFDKGKYYSDTVLITLQSPRVKLGGLANDQFSGFSDIKDRGQQHVSGDLLSSVYSEESEHSGFEFYYQIFLPGEVRNHYKNRGEIADNDKVLSMMPYIWELVVEMLRYQKWELPPRRKPAER
jgi:hypothetical protein